MFNCKACIEKDKRIADLKESLAYLQSVHTGMVLPSYRMDDQAKTLATRQANYAMDGAGSPELEQKTDPNPPEYYANVQRESVAMLTGTY